MVENLENTYFCMHQDGFPENHAFVTHFLRKPHFSHSLVRPKYRAQAGGSELQRANQQEIGEGGCEKSMQLEVFQDY